MKHLWTLLTKDFQKNFDRPKDAQNIKQIPANCVQNTVFRSFTKYSPINTTHLLIVCHGALRVCAKFVANRPIGGALVAVSLLWKELNGGIFKSSSKLMDFQPLFVSHTLSHRHHSNFSSPKTLNYWACIQLFKNFYSFDIITVFVVRIFSLSSDFIMGVYCVS